MDDLGDNTQDAPLGWSEALARGEADRIAGRLVDSQDIHRELRATIDRMITEASADAAKAAARR